MSVVTLVGEPRRHLALRARVSVTFALISLLLTAMLAATTYFLARTYMLDQRERSATRQAFNVVVMWDAHHVSRPPCH